MLDVKERTESLDAGSACQVRYSLGEQGLLVNCKRKERQEDFDGDIGEENKEAKGTKLNKRGRL